MPTLLWLRACRFQQGTQRCRTCRDPCGQPSSLWATPAPPLPPAPAATRRRGRYWRSSHVRYSSVPYLFSFRSFLLLVTVAWLPRRGPASSSLTAPLLALPFRDSSRAGHARE